MAQNMPVSMPVQDLAAMAAIETALSHRARRSANPLSTPFDGMTSAGWATYDERIWDLTVTQPHSVQ